MLTYRADTSLTPGQLVEVPLARGRALAVVSKKVAQPDFVTRPISQILYSRPLPTHLLAAARFIAEYYQTPVGAALGAMLPAIVKSGRKQRKGADGSSGEVTEVAKNSDDAKTEQKSKILQIPLNQAQKKALTALQEAREGTCLLLGLTGSGKTNIYLHEAAKALKAQKSTIVLVPEIALTSQLVRVFREIFGERVVLMHSAQRDTERRRIFEELLMATEPKIVIGPRSALFAPLHNLGLIIIDEEHEPAYWQENAPRYHAVRVASFMAKNAGISCLLGSATPNMTDYYLAKRRGSLVTLLEKAKKSAITPEIRVVDLKKRENFTRNRYFCDDLIKAMQKNVAAGQQTLIFHNRRGSAPLTICENCGEELLCPTCYLPLTLHADRYELVCHTCGFKEPVPTVCPACGSAGLLHKGFGTKLLENELHKLLPEARICRFDADNRVEESLATQYEAVRDGQVDILVGTQTLAKGLDLPRLATVGVVQADAGLNLPDFVAEERCFELVTQVMGRVGRGHLATAEVFIQTFRPEHPLFEYARQEDFVGFAEYTLKKRQTAGFPPFRFVAMANVTLKTEALVVKKARAAAAKLAANPKLQVSPPLPAFHERTTRGYTWQIVVRARSRMELVAALTGLDPNFRVTFDPPSLL